MELEKKWNRNINPKAKKDNLELVNEKIKNRIKFIKNPTPSVIQKEAGDMLKTEQVFTGITDTDALKKYISLYMAIAFSMV